jgi:hypothetical protein
MSDLEDRDENVSYRLLGPADRQAEIHSNRQLPKRRFESDTPRRQDPDHSRPTPQFNDSIEVPRPSLSMRQTRTPSPEEGHEQVSSASPGAG